MSHTTRNRHHHPGGTICIPETLSAKVKASAPSNPIRRLEGV